MNEKDPSARRPSIDDRIVRPPAPGGRRSALVPPAKETASDSTIRMRRVELPDPPVAKAHAGPEQSYVPPTDLGVAWPGKPLAAAAAPLLHLLARVRNHLFQPNPGGLHRYAVRAVGDFEQDAESAGVPPEQIRQTHYALCACLDEAVLNTPWGAGSDWSRAPLTTTFHPDKGDDAFLELLARSLERPAKALAVLEILYLCLSLGFTGQSRGAPRDRGTLAKSRAACFAAIQAQWKAAAPGRSTTELSPHWHGIAAPERRTRGRLPMWVVYAAGLAACGGMFMWVSTFLNAASDAQSARMLAAPPGQMPTIVRAAIVEPPVAPLEIGILDRLRIALRPDIDASAVTVTGTPAMVVLRVNTKSGFAAGSATPIPALTSLLERIGTILRGEPGSLRIIAYTDNHPIRTVRFPSNFELSGARASAASAVIGRVVGDPARLSHEGRGDADPIAPNTTAEGRDLNRRIEIVLRPPE